MFKRVLAVAIVALGAAPSALAGGPTMTIGATEDIVKQPTLVAAKAQMDKLKLAGLRGGRTTPIMDEFAFHPYGDNSSQPPDFQHPSSTSIGLGDYGKLVGLLGAAFDGTAQPGSTLPIVYDEYGVETPIPPPKARFYRGREPTTTKPTDPATQGAYYAQALALTFCQPNVRGIFLFHSVDETDLDRWQSGLYYADGTPKTSLAPTRAAVLAARRGVVTHCDGLRLPVKAKLERPAVSNPRFSFRLTCDIDCTYRARLERL